MTLIVSVVNLLKGYLPYQWDRYSQLQLNAYAITIKYKNTLLLHHHDLWWLNLASVICAKILKAIEMMLKFKNRKLTPFTRCIFFWIRIWVPPLQSAPIRYQIPACYVSGIHGNIFFRAKVCYIWLFAFSPL